jgi:AP endonuclease-1
VSFRYLPLTAISAFMPPRRSNGSTSAKRERSPSSSLSPAPPTQARTVKKVPRPSGADIEVDVPQPSTDTPQGTPKPKKPRKTARSAITKIEPDEEPALPDATPGTSSNKVKKVKKTPRPPKIKVGSDDKPEPPTNGDDPSPPAKKHRVPKAKPWPPPQLAPDRHPPRNGYPVFPLPALSVPPNGGIASSSSTPRPHLVGAHVSIGGGVGGALLRAGMAGANALAMFTKSQRQWKSNPIEGEAIERFRGLMKGKEDGGEWSRWEMAGLMERTAGIDLGAECILVHGSYLINLA